MPERTVADLVRAMETIAPPHLAESWDNVGLLVGDAARPLAGRVLLTIDLTDAVVDEAIAAKAGAIIAYHPPIFSGLKRISGASAGGGRLLRLIESRIAVYSPHTALDAVSGGVTDWLLGLVTGETAHAALAPRALTRAGNDYKVAVFVPAGEPANTVRLAMSGAGAGNIGEYSQCAFAAPGEGTFFGSQASNPEVGQKGRLERAPEVRLEMVCPAQALAAVIAAMKDVHPYEEPAFDIFKLETAPDGGCGPGRIATLAKPARPSELAATLKAALGVSPVLLASAGNEPVTTVAAVPGSGGSLLDAAISAGCGVFITGEMKHHEVLAALDKRCSVILAGHTETERGYLPILAEQLGGALKGIEVRVSRSDRPALEAV